MSNPREPKKYRILVYGIERVGLHWKGGDIDSGNYILKFGGYKDSPRFQDFDGVIFFQGIFESFEQILGFTSSTLKHTWDQDELDKRTKECIALRARDGILCMLLTDKFVDFSEGRDFQETDLCKRLLIMSGVHRRNFSPRLPTLRSHVNELGKFFGLYGAASSSLGEVYGAKIDFKTLASTYDRDPVSVVVGGNTFAIPTLLPRTTEEIVEYFTILSDGIVALWERLRTELPDWVQEYRFDPETEMVAAKTKLQEEMAQIDAGLKQFERLKRVLVLQSEPLVDAVMELFEKALPLKPRREEAFREDLVLVDSEGKTVALAEVKGISKNVAREHVNQADSHRERNGKSPDFPSLLIININMKSCASLADKDQAVAQEQVQHAVRNNILILRTLDLLNLAALHLGGKITSGQVVQLLTKSSGWLKVGESAEVIST